MRNYAPDASPSPVTTGEHHIASIGAADRFRPRNHSVTDDMIEAGERTYRCPPGGVLRSHGELCRQIYLAMHAARPTADLGEDGELVAALVERAFERMAATNSADAALVEGAEDRLASARAKVSDRLILYREAVGKLQSLVALMPTCARRSEALDIIGAVLSRSGG